MFLTGLFSAVFPEEEQRPEKDDGSPRSVAASPAKNGRYRDIDIGEGKVYGSGGGADVRKAAGGRRRPLVSTRLLFREVRERLELIVAQLNLGGGDILFQVSDAGRAWDGQHDGRALQEPGQGELRDGGVVLLGGLIQDAAGRRDRPPRRGTRG